MHLVRGLANLPNYQRHFAGQRCVATMGNFDGMHLGHRQLLERMRQVAGERGMRTAVVFFEPHPREFFAALGGDDKPPYRLSSWREKVEMLADLGMDTAVMLRFDEQMRQTTPAQFVERVFEVLGLGHLVLGDDSRFGVERSGSFDDLKRWGDGAGIGVEGSPTFFFGGERVSSTRIRQALLGGDLALATALLGRCWSYSGRVVRGQQRGRTLGFPTANLRLPAQRLAISGVYAVRAQTADGGDYGAVANMGVRPTFAGEQQSLEVHLLQYSGDLYGQRLRVEFVEKLRDERKFDGVDGLKAQIAADIEQALGVLQ